MFCSFFQFYCFEGERVRNETGFVLFWFLQLSEGKHPEENEEKEEGRKVVENHLKLMKVRMIYQFTYTYQA